MSNNQVPFFDRSVEWSVEIFFEGGDLVSVSNDHEQEFIVSILNRRSYDYYWIGLNDLTKPGVYEWIKTDDTGCAIKILVFLVSNSLTSHNIV